MIAWRLATPEDIARSEQNAITYAAENAEFYRWLNSSDTTETDTEPTRKDQE